MVKVVPQFTPLIATWYLLNDGKFLKYASPDKVNWLAVTDPIKVRIPGEHGTKVGCRHRRQTDQIMSIKVTPIHLPRAATQQQEALS